MRITNLLPITLLSMIIAVPVFAKDMVFGGEIALDKRIKISTLMENPDSYLTSPITIEGTVVGVCAKRGCWMTIASDKRFENLRIKVEDGDMVFPMTAKGSKALATGLLEKNQLTLSETKKRLAHKAQKQGKAFDPNTVKETIATYQLVPTGVKIIE